MPTACQDCLDESIVMRFAMWIRFVVDVDQCTYEASVNSGSSQLIVSACGSMASREKLQPSPKPRFLLAQTMTTDSSLRILSSIYTACPFRETVK